MSWVYTSVIYVFAWSLTISNHPHFLTGLCNSALQLSGEGNLPSGVYFENAMPILDLIVSLPKQRLGHRYRPTFSQCTFAIMQPL